NEAYEVLCDPAKRAAYDRAHQRAFANVREAGHRQTDRERRLLRGAATCICAFCATVHAAHEATNPVSSCASCGSPLYPAVHLQHSDASRRALERLPRKITVSSCLT